jgi:hypothetical protein
VFASVSLRPGNGAWHRGRQGIVKTAALALRFACEIATVAALVAWGWLVYGIVAIFVAASFATAFAPRIWGETP